MCMVKKYNLDFTDWRAIDKNTKLSMAHLWCHQVFYKYFTLNSNLNFMISPLFLHDPTPEAGVRFPAWPQVGKLVVACHWSAVYSTEP